MNHQTQNTKFNSTPSLPQIRDHVGTSSPPTPFSTASPCAQRSQQFPGCPLLVSLGATETCQSCLCQVVGIARLVLQQLITPGVGLGGGGEVGGVPTDPINLYIYIIIFNLLYGLQKSGSCSLVLNHLRDMKVFALARNAMTQKHRGHRGTIKKTCSGNTWIWPLSAWENTANHWRWGQRSETTMNFSEISDDRDPK